MLISSSRQSSAPATLAASSRRATRAVLSRGATNASPIRMSPSSRKRTRAAAIRARNGSVQLEAGKRFHVLLLGSPDPHRRGAHFLRELLYQNNLGSGGPAWSPNYPRWILRQPGSDFTVVTNAFQRVLRVSGDAASCRAGAHGDKQDEPRFRGHGK